MITIQDYKTLDKIYESPDSLVCRARRLRDGRCVLFKVLKEDYPSPGKLASYQREYEIARSLDTEGVVQPYGLEKYQNTLVIITEDFGGTSLKMLARSGKFASGNLRAFLTLGVQIAEILGRIHHADVIHKDINPSNIIFNPKTGAVKITDFGISTILPRQNPVIKHPNALEGTLAYMSPEQTGRMNRSLDYRTDFYSLGVTFYELLTGRLPFESSDPAELVHCHIAKTPVPPHELNPDIPRVISDIMMKLMAKRAEDRYQSAFGLKADLQTCLDQLGNFSGDSETSEAFIKPFEIGENDFSGRFRIPEKLYGREDEINKLMQAFERVSAGSSEMTLIAGYSGVGKSALINEIHKPITGKSGYFVSGKFEQFQRDIPYYAFIQAFKELVSLILTETEADLAVWRKRILNGVGNIGKVLTDIIPNLEMIIGSQPEVPELGPMEAQNRFNFVFGNFVKALCHKDHPVVLVLDDLQWADAASLNLMNILMRDSEIGYLLLIGAYRDNEVSRSHPLMTALDEINRENPVIRTITLQNLCFENVSELISDALQSSEALGKEIAALVRKKTQGNAFFVKQFLYSLYEDNLLTFVFENREWQADISAIRKARITDNVVELMERKLRRLPEAAQNILSLAACIGSRFDPETLALISEKSPEAIFRELHHGLAESLIIETGNSKPETGNSTYDDPVSSFKHHASHVTLQVSSLKFSHDRIQQAAYSLIPDAEKDAVHLKIGRLMLQNTEYDEQTGKIFDIVNQLNLGAELITSQSERDQLAELNLRAGRKAKSSAAYEPAFKYITAGLNLLEPESWRKVYDLTLSLFTEASETAYLSGEYEEVERLARLVDQNAPYLLDKVKVYEIRIRAFIAQNKLVEAVNTGLSILKRLGVRFPETPGKPDILLGFVKIRFALLGKHIPDLAELPQMTDPTMKAAMRILLTIAPPVYTSNPGLFPLIGFKMTLALRHGNSPESCIAYIGCGLNFCSLGKIDSGYQFGLLALDLLDQLNAKEFRAYTLCLFNCFIRHWKEHIRETLGPFREAHQVGLETGDFLSAGISSYFYCLHGFFAGKALEVLEQEMSSSTHVVSRLKQEKALEVNRIYRQMISNLMGRAENPCRLIGESYNETEDLQSHIEANDRNMIYYVCLNKLILSYLFQEYTRAAEHAALAEQYIGAVRAGIVVPVFCFYDSLTQLALYGGAQKSEKRRILRKVAVNQKKMKKWADHAPMNYLHKFYLVEAEQMRILGKDGNAAEYYEQAIRLAGEHEYINEQALANELAAKFWLEKNMSAPARAYMQDARYRYLRWGAAAKVRDLDKRYGQLLAIKRTETGITETFETTFTVGSGETLDLAAVMKASQAISGQIRLDKLLTQLMRIVMENAGAQKACLLLETRGELFVEAEAGVGSEDVTLLQSVPVKDAAFLSQRLITYTARTGTDIVLNDAAKEDRFANDPYIRANKPKSLVCAPLIRQGKLIGMLWLENNLTSGAFTSEHLRLLRILSGQAAISVENARLYENLEQKVGERTLELNQALGKIMDSIRYAERIQRSLLPNSDEVKTYLPDSFFLWMPRDIVGGDIYFTERFEDGIIIAVIDCTGHGVPGAFMSMIASSFIRRITTTFKCHDPAEILKQLNLIVKTSLQQNRKDAPSDDGMDAAVCFVEARGEGREVRGTPHTPNLIFAGAKLPLFYVHNREVTVIRGDKQSIGYKRSDPDFEFTNHRLPIEKGMSFYISTDGFWDQLGGERRRSFGKKRFRALLKEAAGLSFEQQQEILVRWFEEYKGADERQDDVTVAGFGF